MFPLLYGFCFFNPDAETEEALLTNIAKQINANNTAGEVAVSCIARFEMARFAEAYHDYEELH